MNIPLNPKKPNDSYTPNLKYHLHSFYHKNAILHLRSHSAKKIHSPSSPKHVIYLSVQIILYIHRNILSLSCAQNSPSTTPKNILVLYRSLYIKPLSTLYIHIVGVNSSMLFFFKNPPKNKTPKYIYHHSYVLAHLVHVKKLGAISPIVS